MNYRSCLGSRRRRKLIPRWPDRAFGALSGRRIDREPFDSFLVRPREVGLVDQDDSGADDVVEATAGRFHLCLDIDQALPNLQQDRIADDRAGRRIERAVAGDEDLACGLGAISKGPWRVVVALSVYLMCRDMACRSARRVRSSLAGACQRLWRGQYVAQPDDLLNYGPVGRRNGVRPHPEPTPDADVRWQVEELWSAAVTHRSPPQTPERSGPWCRYWCAAVPAQRWAWARRRRVLGRS